MAIRTPIKPTGNVATDFATIQAEIDAASNGDVVILDAHNAGGVLTAWKFGKYLPVAQVDFNIISPRGNTFKYTDAMIQYDSAGKRWTDPEFDPQLERSYDIGFEAWERAPAGQLWTCIRVDKAITIRGEVDGGGVPITVIDQAEYEGLTSGNATFITIRPVGSTNPPRFENLKFTNNTEPLNMLYPTEVDNCYFVDSKGCDIAGEVDIAWTYPRWSQSNRCEFSHAKRTKIENCKFLSTEGHTSGFFGIDNNGSEGYIRNCEFDQFVGEGSIWWGGVTNWTATGWYQAAADIICAPCRNLKILGCDFKTSGSYYPDYNNTNCIRHMCFWGTEIDGTVIKDCVFDSKDPTKPMNCAVWLAGAAASDPTYQGLGRMSNVTVTKNTFKKVVDALNTGWYSNGIQLVSWFGDATQLKDIKIARNTFTDSWMESDGYFGLIGLFDAYSCDIVANDMEDCGAPGISVYPTVPEKGCAIYLGENTFKCRVLQQGQLPGEVDEFVIDKGDNFVVEDHCRNGHKNPHSGQDAVLRELQRHKRARA